MVSRLFEDFDSIIVLDTETTGFDPRSDEIIELAMLRAQTDGEGFQVVEEYDEFVSLSPDRTLPPEITELTGISPETLSLHGRPKKEVCEALYDMFSVSRPLVVAYNAQFDMGFLYYMLRSFGKTDVLRSIKMLDALTVYRDRRPFPHRLSSAIEAYELEAENTHRAIDDTRAAYELLRAMAEEKDDLLSYVNIFGYNPRHGVSGQRISSVRYLPQGFEPGEPIYTKL